MVELRRHQSESKHSYGIDSFGGRVTEMKEIGVFDPLEVKQQVIKCATEVASIILRIDEALTVPGNKPSAPGGQRTSPPLADDE